MEEWVVSTMERLGYVGIALLMFLENLFPPIPSEVIMPLAGFTVAKGEMTMPLAITAGVVGTLLGAVPWYGAGWLLGQERLSQFLDRLPRWTGLSGEDITKASAWFEQHGQKAVLLGRLVPGVRTLISVPAGIARMSPVTFFSYSTVGIIGWTTFLAYSGYLLGANYKLIEPYIDTLSKIVLVILGAAFGVFLYNRYKQRRDNDQ
ncbi:MAG: DedA family protein [Pseudanabaenaceae cyanobacterium SKYGB_i_bin29]|nr:DedA family protein [Pseudanabaenaceae cyanobacterium SKYG29]MDW8421684.1 DedA family protein [Pseudanabaenaceae cyanobacterium SKYGB_i_bin29]